MKLKKWVKDPDFFWWYRTPPTIDWAKEGFKSLVKNGKCKDCFFNERLEFGKGTRCYYNNFNNKSLQNINFHCNGFKPFYFYDPKVKNINHSILLKKEQLEN